MLPKYKVYHTPKRILCYAKYHHNHNSRSISEYTLVCKVNKKTHKVYWLVNGMDALTKSMLAGAFEIRDYWRSTKAQKVFIGRLVAEACDLQELIQPEEQTRYSLLSSKNDKLCTMIYHRRRKIMQKAGQDHFFKSVIGTNAKELRAQLLRGQSAKKIRTMLKRYGVDLTVEYCRLGLGFQPLKHIPRDNLRKVFNLMEIDHTDFEGPYWQIADVDRMYGNIIQCQHDYKFPTKGAHTLSDIHEILVRDYSRVTTPNVEIPYASFQPKKFNITIEDIEFKLPAMTHDLIDVGQKLSNCVGSYSDSVISGRSTIIVGYKEGEPRICMELQGDTMYQCSGPCNGTINDEEKLIVDKYCEKNKIQKGRYYSYGW